MKKVLLALCACMALCAASGATAAKVPPKTTVPPNPCGKTITPALVKQVTGVTVFLNTPTLKSHYYKASGSFACQFGSPTSVNNAIEISLVRYPKGTTKAAKFFGQIKAAGPKGTANADACWTRDQQTYPDPLVEDCTWTPVAGLGKQAAVFANQMFVQFPHAVMTMITGGQKDDPAGNVAPRRTFTYTQMIALAKAATAKVKP
jgi:hypothetical protein